MSVERATRVSNLIFIGLLLFATGCSRESKVRRHLERADGYFKSQEYLKAEIEYLNVLRLAPGNPVAVRQLGLVLFEQGQYPQAFAFLEQAKPADPNNLQIRAKLGFGALIAGDLPRARDEAVFILSRQPTNEEAFVLLADAVGTGQIEQTRKLLESYRAQATGLAGFHVAVGLLELRAGNRAAAEASLKEAVRLNPRSATARATLGNFYLREKRADLAEAELKAAAEVAPPHSLLSMSYADFKIRQGQVEEGKRLLTELAQKTPDFMPVHVRRAELAFAQKNYAECESLLKAITDRGRASFDAQFLQGRLRMARGDAAGAQKEFQRLLAAFPKTPQLYYQLALAHLAGRDTDAASTSLNEALVLDPNYADAILLAADLGMRRGEYSTAITAMSELLKRDTNSARARMVLATAHAGRKDYAAALVEYQKLAEAFPKDPQFPFAVGNIHLRQKDTNAARQAFAHALSIDKGYWPAFESVIDLDLNAGKSAEALQRVETQISQAPDQAPLQLLLAKVLLAEGKTNQAEAALLKAVDLNREFRSAYVLLATVYVNTGRHQEALDRLQAILAKQPNDITALMMAAAIQDELKNFSASRDYYEKILTIHPGSPAVLNNLAYIYSEHLNQLDRAYDLAQKTRELLPREPAAADTLGWVLYKRGEYGRALSLLEESVQMLPDHPEVLFHLAMTQYALCQEERARSNFEKSLAHAGDFAGRAECEKRIAVLNMKVDQADANTIRQLEKLLEDRPTDPIVLSRLARVYEAKGEGAKAAGLYERQLKLNPNSISAMTGLAEFYLQHEKNAAKALELGRKARALAPQDAAVGHTLGRLAYAGGDHKWALSLLQESARKLPDDSQVALDLALAQFGNGQLREAEASLTRILAGNSSDTKGNAHVEELLKWVRLCASHDDVEKSQIQQVLKSKPEHLAARFLDGRLRQHQGDFKGAQAAFESVLRQFPFFTPANRELAYLYSTHLADDQKALDHALKAREADRQDTRVAKTLGIISYKRNDFRRSAEFLKESLRDRASDAEVHFYLGMAEFKLGDHPESREALNKAVALSPDAKFVAEAKRTLVQLQ